MVLSIFLNCEILFILQQCEIFLLLLGNIFLFQFITELLCRSWMLKIKKNIESLIYFKRHTASNKNTTDIYEVFHSTIMTKFPYYVCMSHEPTVCVCLTPLPCVYVSLPPPCVYVSRPHRVCMSHAPTVCDVSLCTCRQAQ